VFKKLLLLSFVLVTAPSYTIDSRTKEEIEKKSENKINPTDQISDFLAASLAILATDPMVDTIIDSAADSLEKLKKFLDSAKKTSHEIDEFIDKLALLKESEQLKNLFEVLSKKAALEAKEIVDKTIEKLIEKLSQQDLSERELDILVNRAKKIFSKYY